MFPSSTKREIRHFHVVVVQWRQRNVQKSVMHVQSCCFANLNLLLFCRSRCRHRRRCLSSLIDKTERRISFSRLMYELVLSFSSALSLLCCDHSKETSLIALSPWHCLLQFCSQHQIWKFSLFWQFLDSVFLISGIMKVSVSVICLGLRPGSDAAPLMCRTWLGWITCGKREASESIWYGSFSLVRQKR